MSAINDALRRASSAAKSGPSASPLPSMPVEPESSESAPPPPPPISAEPPPPPQAPPIVGRAAPPPLLRSQPAPNGSKLVLVFVILVVLGLGGAAGFFFWQKQHHPAFAKNEQKVETEEVTDNERLAALFGDEKAGAKMAGADDRSHPAASKPAPIVRAPERPQPAPAPVAITPTPAPVPVVHTPVRFPPLRLQSIFFRPSSPSVIINGKTLFVTDEINGVTVADIQPASVTLVLSGQTNVLTLR